MKIKLTRDEARTVQRNFFPYLERLIETRILENRSCIDLQLNYKMIRCNFLEVVKIFDRKLIGIANQFQIKFTDSQGIVLFKLLIALPLKEDEFYLVQLRQQIISALHVQMV